MAAVSGVSLAARWSCSAAMATFMLSAAQARLRTASGAQPSSWAACSHTSMTSSAWWLLYLSVRVAGGMDQVVQRGVRLALAQLAGALVHLANAGDEFGPGPRLAQRHVEQRAQAFPLVGHGDVGAGQAFAAALLRACLGDGLQRRVLAHHRADGGAELAPPFVGFVLVGKQRLRAQVVELLGTGDRLPRRQQQPPAGVAHAEGQRRLHAQVFG